MRILLIEPRISQKMVGFTHMVRPEPLALEIIAATVPDHEVKIFDMRVDSTPLAEVLSSFHPDLVGTTGYTTDVPTMQMLLKEVKALDPAIITVVGGYHASLVPKDFDFEAVDYIVVGEGEITFRELVAALSEGKDTTSIAGLIYRVDGHQVETRVRLPLKKMDDHPLPLRHLTDQYRSRYHFHFWDNPYVVETTRGCPYRCTFCAVWKFHNKRCRERSPELVIEDLKNVASKIVCFVDDNFLQNLPRAERLCELVEQAGLQARYWIQARADSIVRRPDVVERWAKAGLHAALIGFEKIDEKGLQSVHKNSSTKINEEAMEILNANGVDMWGSFIVDPEWTSADFDALIGYVKAKRIAFPLFTILTPLPGTAFFQEKLNELVTSNYEVFDFLHTVLPTKLPIDEFYANMARLYASTTMGWAELKQRIKSGYIPLSALERVRGVLKDVTDPEAYLSSVVAR
ncbi:MAG: cobalamin B12-binding domain-containing protein [Chloroflexi bacterium]|nr:cobalamin B12-binding domain-containing protein [Chloroflexota bacterium]